MSSKGAEKKDLLAELNELLTKSRKPWVNKGAIGGTALDVKTPEEEWKEKTGDFLRSLTTR